MAFDGLSLGQTRRGAASASSSSNGQPAALQRRMGALAGSKDQVQRLYDIALSNGGTCEGPPGPRGEGFYAAYFRDPDGNKLNAFVMGPDAR